MRITEFGRSVGGAVLRRVGRAASRLQEESGLRVDVLESDDEYLVVFDAPGVHASDVQVYYREGSVEVRVDRFREFREDYEMLFPGRGLTLDGSADLPEDAVVTVEDARARLNDDGTLYVFLPKSETAETGEPVGETTVPTGESPDDATGGGDSTGAPGDVDPA